MSNAVPLVSTPDSVVQHSSVCHRTRTALPTTSTNVTGGLRGFVGLPGERILLACDSSTFCDSLTTDADLPMACGAFGIFSICCRFLCFPFWCCCCCTCVPSSRWRVHLTDRRIVIQETLKFLCIPIATVQESFRYKDLQHVSVRKDMDFMRATIGFVWLLWAVLTWLGLHVIGIALAVVFIIIAVVFWTFAWKNTQNLRTLTLDFYKNQTVQSWLPFMDSVLTPVVIGSTIRKHIRLPPPVCRVIMQSLYENNLTQFAEDKDGL